MVKRKVTSRREKGERRKFDGKWFNFYWSYPNKNKAQGIADGLRKQGYYVRISKRTKRPVRYILWRRKK